MGAQVPAGDVPPDPSPTATVVLPTPPTGGVSPAPNPARTRFLALGVILIVVVAAVALTGLWTLGLGPFSTSKSTSPGESFTQAASAAETAVSSRAGGPWSLAGGSAYRWPSSAPENTSVLSEALAGSGCTVSLLTTDSTFDIPATGGSTTSGDSAAWVILLAGNGTVLIVPVLGGSASLMATLGGSGCALVEAGVGLGLPTGFIDSPEAMADADAQGGSAFLANHSAVEISYAISPQVTLSRAVVAHSEWTVTMTNCDESGMTGTTLDGKPAAQFTDEVNATSGAANAGVTVPTVCPTTSGARTLGEPRFSSFGQGEEWESLRPAHDNPVMWKLP
jgi:hypothetical protein